MDAVRLLEPEEEVAFRAAAADAGLRLDRAIARRLPWASRTRVTRWIREGRASVDGRMARRPARALAAGEQVRLLAPKTPRDLGRPLDDLLALPIAFHGEGWVVADKPGGVPSHPGGGVVKRTLLTAMGVRLRALCESGGPWLPHRLDRETSGLNVVALRRDALGRFASAFFEGRIRRFYRARVRGCVDAGASWVDLRYPLRRVGEKPIRVAVATDGLPAHTRLCRLVQGETWTDLRLEAVTGRQHQLRVHLAHLGHPIVGDPIYDREQQPGERLQLRADALWIPADVAGTAEAIWISLER